MAQEHSTKILTTALAEFSAKSLYGVRINEIAQKPCVNKRLICEWFDRKNGLYCYVPEIVYDRLADKRKIST